MPNMNRERGDVERGWLRKPSVKTKDIKTSKEVVHRTLWEHKVKENWHLTQFGFVAAGRWQESVARGENGQGQLS